MIYEQLFIIFVYNVQLCMIQQWMFFLVIYLLLKRGKAFGMQKLKQIYMEVIIGMYMIYDSRYGVMIKLFIRVHV